MERNPYAPPAAPVAEPVEPPTEVAPRWRRFLNMLIDFAGYMLFASIVGVIIGLVAPSMIASLENLGTVGNYLVGMVLLTAYYVPFELYFARTPGKLLTGTRVVTEDGDTPTFRHILIRTVVRFVPFEAFSFFRSGGIGWHDDWSHTRVVLVRGRKAS